MSDAISKPCPTCHGLGRVPLDGHTEDELRAAIDARLGDAKARFEERLARQQAQAEPAVGHG